MRVNIKSAGNLLIIEPMKSKIELLVTKEIRPDGIYCSKAISTKLTLKQAVKVRDALDEAIRGLE